MLAPLGLLLAALALSPTQKEAERLTRRSMVEYNVGDFTAALEDIKKAYELSERPELLFNLAQCHRALEHWKQAEFFYRGYLRGKPSAQNRSQVEALIAEMQRHQAEAPVPLVPPAAASVAPATATALPAAEPAKAAPPPAVEKKAARSRIAAYVLAGVALVAAGVATYGFVQVGGFNGAVAGHQSGLTTGSYRNAQTMSYVGYGATGAGVLALGGAAAAWFW